MGNTNAVGNLAAAAYADGHVDLRMPESVSSKGFVPHEVDPHSLPDSLQIKQRGNDPHHFEIMPKEENMTPAEFERALQEIKTKPITCK